MRLGRINAAGLDTYRNGSRRRRVSTAKRPRVNKVSRIIWAMLNSGKQAPASVQKATAPCRAFTAAIDCNHQANPIAIQE